MLSLHRSSHGKSTVLCLIAALTGCWSELSTDPNDEAEDQAGTVAVDPGRMVPTREIFVPRLPPRDDTGVVSLIAGDSAKVNDVTVDFLKVTEDSRCPTGVTCVWEGQGVVALRATLDGGTPEDFLLTLRAAHPELASQIVARHHFALLELAPHPAADIIIEPSKYTIELRVADLTADDGAGR